MSLVLDRSPIASPSTREKPSLRTGFDTKQGRSRVSSLPRAFEFKQSATQSLSQDRYTTLAAIERMAVPLYSDFGREVYYEAADPGYKRYFTRDAIKTAMMAGSRSMLQSQIDFAVRRLGIKMDPLTGEEPGKPLHEWPAKGEHIEPFREGLYPTYNACDTGAVLLLGIAALIEHGDRDAAHRYRRVIPMITAYIRRHVNVQGLFVEDPAFAGAANPDGRERKFALKVTAWKDSELNRAGRREPHYPIVYSATHFQNAYALQLIGRVMGDERLRRFGRYMTEQGLVHLWRGDHFISAVDDDGVIDPPSSDSLEALLYIEPRQLPDGYASRMENYMQQLETDAGYRAGIPAVPDMDMYHMKVWVHSQAELNAAARLHHLAKAGEITERVRAFIDRDSGVYPELIEPDVYTTGGNSKQLWAMGADLYFLNPEQSYLL